MKGQILSRIHSYQNIPIIASKNNRQSNNISSKLINETKILKFQTIKSRESPDKCLKILSPQIKKPSHRFLATGTINGMDKKSFNISSQKQIKRSLNFQIKPFEKSTEQKNYKMPKKPTDKNYSLKSFSKTIEKQCQNYPNRLNLVSSPAEEKASESSINKYQIRKKELLKFHNKTQINKTGNIGVGSEQNIRNLDSKEDPKDPQLNHIKKDIMMKTVNVFKDYKLSPYFNFSNKKCSIKSPAKTGPTKSLNRIPTSVLTQKQEDVSIEMSQSESKKQIEQPSTNELNLEFGCSQIQQKQLINDSSFLQPAQRMIINQLEKTNKKDDPKKKKWMKLPNDFFQP